MTGDRDDDLPARDAATFLHQAGSTPVARSFAACRGAWAEDGHGHRFMDFHGNTCHNIGHAHPRLIAALSRQLAELPFTPRGFTCAPAVELAERLAALWPHGPARVLLGTSGTDAIEMALKLAFIATGRRGTLAFEGCWHGAALGALSVGGYTAERAPYPRLDGCAHVAPFWETSGPTCLAAIAAVLERRQTACLVAEPVHAVPHRAPEGFWQGVREICDATATLLVFDEIPSGLGRTGRLFADAQTGIAPDMTVLGKSLGGGAVPVSALIARAGLNLAGGHAIGHYTHQKNPVLARAGLTVLEILQDEALVEAAAARGARLLAGLETLAAGSPVYARALGEGLMTALELAPGIDPDAVRAGAWARGLNLGAHGRFLTLSPPLTISDAEMLEALAILSATAEAVAGEGAGLP